MRLNSFRSFHKSVSRLKLLYEVTVHSYNLLYEDGRTRLRQPAAAGTKVKIDLEQRSVFRPLRLLTFHAKDVYPQLLRATLLVRLVTAYETYLVDTIDDISRRSTDPFSNDTRIDITQRHLLAMDRKQTLRQHIVDRTTRQLTSGGLEQIRKFYKQSLSVDIAPHGVQFSEIDEIHERRHIHVHRAGYADTQYVHKYPSSRAQVDSFLPVTEGYLMRAMDVLARSALHVKQMVEAKYPEPHAWVYRFGSQSLATIPESLVLVEALTRSHQAISSLVDLSEPLHRSSKIADVVVWIATREDKLRWLVGGTPKQVSGFFKTLKPYEERGDLSNIDSFKLKRH